MTIRERAIQVCAIAASDPGMDHSYGMICDHLGLSDPWTHKAGQLAVAAWAKAHNYLPRTGGVRPWSVEVDLLAQELLEAGWCFGDDIADYIKR